MNLEKTYSKIATKFPMFKYDFKQFKAAGIAEVRIDGYQNETIDISEENKFILYNGNFVTSLVEPIMINDEPYVVFVRVISDDMRELDDLQGHFEVSKQNESTSPLSFPFIGNILSDEIIYKKKEYIFDDNEDMTRLATKVHFSETEILNLYDKLNSNLVYLSKLMSYILYSGTMLD